MKGGEKMQKLNDILLLIAGLALLPAVGGWIGSDIAMYIAGVGVGLVGIMGLIGK